MALPITDALLHRAVESLEAGGWRYTRRQLYYATCAEAELPPSNAAANGEAGLGVLLILLGVILFKVGVAGLVLVALGVLLLAAGFAARLRRPVLHGRLLAMSYEEFCARIATVELPNMIVEKALSLADQQRAQPRGRSVMVLCDRDETAQLIAANLDGAQLHDVTVRTGSTDDAADARSVICLHDASPAGCALVAEVRDAAPAAIDAGLRPRDLEPDEREQVLQGAPARLPRDLSTVLDETEVDWLRSGRRVEVATRTPEQVMAMLHAALGATSG